MLFNKAIIFGLIGTLCFTLTGCDKTVPQSKIDSLKSSIANEAFSDYLVKKYKKNGSSDLVFITKSYEQGNKPFDPYQGGRDMYSSPDFLKKCLVYIPLQSNDIKVYNYLFLAKGYELKDNNFKFDHTQFNKCVENRLNSIPLSFDNLTAFSNDPEIQEYKEKVPAIADMIKTAKADDHITIGEALEIYLAVYKATEVSLFEKI
ncbi:hypothetical protein ABH307_00540 [Acinetobacter pittii]|uniref:hypothetical protein n=1 Tax=Acinetobacter pittii TaxID=48296 RepID=UPI003261CE14